MGEGFTDAELQAFLEELTALTHKHKIVILQHPDNIASPPILVSMDQHDQNPGQYRFNPGDCYVVWYRGVQ